MEYLYRLYDVDNRLLYIGVTTSPARRFREHVQDSNAWWPSVHRSNICRLSVTRTEARAIEAAAIRAERPLRNKLHAISSAGVRPRAEVIVVLRDAVEARQRRDEIIDRARTEFRDALIRAREAGATLTEIGDALKMSHVAIMKFLKAKQ